MSLLSTQKDCAIPYFFRQPFFQPSVALVLLQQADYEVDHYFLKSALCQSTENAESLTKHSVLNVCPELRFPELCMKTLSLLFFYYNSNYQTKNCVGPFRITDLPHPYCPETVILLLHIKSCSKAIGLAKHILYSPEIQVATNLDFSMKTTCM